MTAGGRYANSLSCTNLRTTSATPPPTRLPTAEFVDRYTSLVGEIIGPEAAFVLRAMFLAGGVRTD